MRKATLLLKNCTNITDVMAHAIFVEVKVYEK